MSRDVKWVEAEAAIEHDILKKEVRLVNQTWGITCYASTGYYRLIDDCACAIGTYLIGREDTPDGYTSDAARYLGVEYEWVIGVMDGFDNTHRGLVYYHQQPAYADGHTTGERLRLKYLSGTVPAPHGQ